MFSGKQSGELNLPTELAGFEETLARFQPAPSRIDRDRLMFAAGVARGRRDTMADAGGGVPRDDRASSVAAYSGRRDLARMVWPLTAAVALLAAAMTCALWITERSRTPRTIQKIVYVKSDSANGLVDNAAPTPVVPSRAPSTEWRPAHRDAFNAESQYGAILAMMPRGIEDYLVLRQLILAHGIDALPWETRSVDRRSFDRRSQSPATVGQLMHELMLRTNDDVKTSDNANRDEGRDGLAWNLIHFQRHGVLC